MGALLFFSYVIFTIIVLYNTKPLAWVVGSSVYLLISFIFLPFSIITLFFAIVILIIISFIYSHSLRRSISNLLYENAKKNIPKLSKTEEEALKAGDIWLEQSIFVGNPDWATLHQTSSVLTQEEKDFLENETEVLCKLINDWDIIQAHDLPEEIWDYLKSNSFFGLVIPKAYGGRGFSARAHSDIVFKIASRSGVTAVTVMVPNSLGPGELLCHYGTEEQKKQYLPNLAKGIDIPCFALTEPNAGSDATSITSTAIVIENKIGKTTELSLQINLNKRWITLAPVATLIGLAVNLQDPHGLLQGKGEEGITCLLIPRTTKNLEIGNRHLPCNQPFMNGSIRGENIIVPITTIIGGQENAGKGWQMLVECLSIGRSISLPALSGASSSVCYLTTGAFAKIRRQFNVELSQFEGIKEKLAEIAGLNYLINSTRLFTVAAVQQHKKPAVASAMTKYFNTELARIVINDAMDIHAGRGVVSGPRNYLSTLYQGIPISITVEGANIMSRNLLIFGQGSMVCHPYIREEFYAVLNEDKSKFHELLWQHIGYFIKNLAKTIGSAWTGGVFIKVPKNPLKREYQRLSRLSYAFAFIADLLLILLGGSLKRKERISARLADAFSYLYMAMGVLRFANENNHEKDHILHAKWAVTYCYYYAQKAMLTLCSNLSNPIIGWFIRLVALPLGQTMQYPEDKLDHNLSSLMTKNNSYRDMLLASVYLSKDSNQPLDRMELTFQLILQHNEIYQKIRDILRYKGQEFKDKLTKKVQQQEISQEEMLKILQIERACWDAIQVDEFNFTAIQQGKFTSITNLFQNPMD